MISFLSGAVAQGERRAVTQIDVVPVQVEGMTVEAEGDIAEDANGGSTCVRHIIVQVVAVADQDVAAGCQFRPVCVMIGCVAGLRLAARAFPARSYSYDEPS